MRSYKKKDVFNRFSKFLTYHQMSINYEERHNFIWSEIERLDIHIQRTFDNCFYPYSIRMNMVKRFIFVYREHLSFLEGYQAYLENNNSDSKILPILQGQIERTRNRLDSFDEQLQELYLGVKNRCF